MPFKGIPYHLVSEEVKERTQEIIRLCQTGKTNSNWKGDAVGYGALHDWVKSRLDKPELCQNCKKKQPYDLANINGEYKRDLKDWWWICRHCHMTLDGRLDRLHEISIKLPRVRGRLSKRTDVV